MICFFVDSIVTSVKNVMVWISLEVMWRLLNQLLFVEMCCTQQHLSCLFTATMRWDFGYYNLYNTCVLNHGQRSVLDNGSAAIHCTSIISTTNNKGQIMNQHHGVNSWLYSICLVKVCAVYVFYVHQIVVYWSYICMVFQIPAPCAPF